MITHFLNLVALDCLDEIDLEKNENFVLYCDSISLLIKMRILGLKPVYNPGTTMVDKMIDHSNKKEYLFLTPSYIPQIRNQIVLPYFEDVKKDNIDDIVSSINEFKNIESIYLCISSPKQNILAHRLHQSINVDNIFCVGGAISVMLSKHRNSNNFFSKSGLQWLLFLFIDPKRSMNKINKTLQKFFSQKTNIIILSKGKFFE